MTATRKVKPRKRGRPPADLGGELCAKDKLVETALRLFYRYGINSIGVDRIIAESNVSKMTFFKHFPTKRDLILQFLKVRDQRFSEWFDKTLEAKANGKKKKLGVVVDVIETWFMSADFRGCAFINTTAESGPERNEEKLLCLGHKNHFANALEELAKCDGYKNPKTIADHLAIAIDGATIRAQMDGPKAGVVALRSLVNTILNQQ